MILAALILSAVLQAQAAPRLLVVVSVDQMRADYLDGKYTGGLARLAREGFVFTQARHSHIPTETGPGHAAILTGKFPGGHGIASNAWYDRVLGTSTYCVDDSVHGLGPEHLWAYTLGDALKAKDRLSRVVSVSLKDRAAILLGGKRPDMALWYSSSRKKFRTSSYYGGDPQWLAGFNERLGDAGVNGGTPEADRRTLELALMAAERYDLGVDDHPDILAISFSATDYIGHRYGPGTPQMAEQLKQLDGVIGDLFVWLEKTVGRGRFDVVLTADHGAHGRPKTAKRVVWTDLDARMEKALQAELPAPRPWIVEEDFPLLVLNLPQAAAMGFPRNKFLKRAASALERVDGMAKAYITDDLDERDEFYPVYSRSVVPGRSGDVIMRPSRDLVVIDPGQEDSHGSPYDYDTHVPLVFWGSDFKTGRSSEPARVVDLAPTAAAALGLEFKPEKDSRVLPVFAHDAR